MARARRASPSLAQEEIPGTESPDRIPELHALGLELLDLEERAREAKKAEKLKRAECGAELHRLGLEEYEVDGIELWIEGKEQVKVRSEEGRPKGKVKKSLKGSEE